MTSFSANRQTSAGRLRRLTVLGAAVALLATAACGSEAGTTPAKDAKSSSGSASKSAPVVKPALTDAQYLTNGSEFVDAAKATWDATAKVVPIELKEMSFTPSSVTLEAGKPYVLKLVNKGKVKHEFSAGQFFRASANRKVSSESGAVKVPFFTEIEVLPGKTAEVFVIPVIPGTFKMLCELPGHLEAGMSGKITVTGKAPTIPAPVLGDVASGAWLQTAGKMLDAAKPTWDAKAKTVQIAAGEAGAKMFFKPKNLTLKVGTPYKIELMNVGKVEHEYTADEFFASIAFRKAEDKTGEYKGLLLKEAEVLPGQQIDLYLIPNKVGTFKILCAIPGHNEAGMNGTITVTK